MLHSAGKAASAQMIKTGSIKLALRAGVAPNPLEVTKGKRMSAKSRNVTDLEVHPLHSVCNGLRASSVSDRRVLGVLLNGSNVLLSIYFLPLIQGQATVATALAGCSRPHSHQQCFPAVPG